MAFLYDFKVYCTQTRLYLRGDFGESNPPKLFRVLLCYSKIIILVFRVIKIITGLRHINKYNLQPPNYQLRPCTHTG